MSSSSDSLGKVPTISRDAVITFSIGTVSISHLQLALSLLTKGLDTTGLTERITSGTVSEPTEVAVIGLSNILRHLYTLAEQQGHIVYEGLTIGDLR